MSSISLAYDVDPVSRTDTSPLCAADRSCLRISSFLTEPICFVSSLVYKLRTPLDPTKFDNLNSRTKEVALRVLISLGLIVAIANTPMTLGFLLLTGALGKVFRAIGFGLQKNNFTHVDMGGPEVDVVGPLRVFHKNYCGPAGGLTFDHGGVNSWRQRLDTIVREIRDSKAHVVELNEIYDAAFAEALIKELHGEFAHAYVHMGKTLFGNVGGLMTLTKCAVHSFSHTEFRNSDWSLKRGFTEIEIKRRPQDAAPCARVIGTHLIHGNKLKDRANRRDQIAQIVDSLAQPRIRNHQVEAPLDTVLCGDANIKYGSEDDLYLRQFVVHGYSGAEPTCTDRLTAQWYQRAPGPDETIDIMSQLRRHTLDGRILAAVANTGALQNVQLDHSYRPDYDTRTASSDHRGLSGELALA